MKPARHPVTHPFAQTNLQLYNQLISGGYSEVDLETVRRCYDFATHLFSGLYRPTGKPFLAHLVGTASILASARTRVAVVGAGVLHAAYTHGDFGVQFPSSRRRARVRRCSNQEIEALVAAYERLSWTGESVAAMRNVPGLLAPNQRDIVLIRLANELEDSLDLGLLYCLKGDERELATGLYLDTVVELARELGYVDIAGFLDRSVQENRVAPAPPLALRTAAHESYTMLPTSYTVRPVVKVGRSLSTLILPLADRLVKAIRSELVQR